MFCHWGERAPPPGLSIGLIVALLIWQVMVTNVTSLLKTVKAVEDEATRGTRALEAAIECIKQELTVSAPDRSKVFFMIYLESKCWDPAFLEKKISKKISVSVIQGKTEKLFVLFFCYGQLFSSRFLLNSCRFPTALIRVWVADVSEEGRF